MNQIESDCLDTRLHQPTYKMKFLVLLAIAVACASADVLSGDATAPILRSNSVSSPDGNSFSYEFESGNGINVQAGGVVNNPNSDEPSLEIKGSYSYTAPDGTPVQTIYIANQNGFEAQGSHIPVAPAVPEAILRSLAYIAAHPPPAESVKKY